MDKKRNIEDNEHDAAQGAKRLRSQPGPSVDVEAQAGSDSEQPMTLKEVPCKKHPGHKKFISVPDFKEFHLPLVDNPKGRELLKAVITLTVRLTVSYTSWERDEQDEFKSSRGTKKVRYGTGFVTYVNYQESCEYGMCPEGKYEKHYGFLVRTSRHIVYNTEEARATCVDFNFDDEVDQQMTSLQGTEVWQCSIENDWCTFWTNTHEEELGEAIHNARKITYYSKPEDFVLSEVSKLPPGPEVVMIVSHPHGCAKHVTFGKLTCNDEKFPSIEYDAPTCPGSSGALVLRYETNNPDLLKQYIHLAPVHWGGYEDGSLNVAYWYWWRKRY